MTKSLPPTKSTQSIATEGLFYFFLNLRKGEIRKTVDKLRAQHPQESPDQLARRLIAARSQLALLGGALLSLPLLIPRLSLALKLSGVVAATSVLTRLNLYLILEIALLYDRDIDDSARVPEMLAVVALSGLGSTAPLLAAPALSQTPGLAVPAGLLSSATVTQLIGRAAMRFYADSPPLHGPANPSSTPAANES